jgi:glycosyltransferase involved in cell wall biosynthesis
MMMSKQKPLRVLFLHSTKHHASEYNVHKLLAENVDPDLVDSYFIWQTHTKDSSQDIVPKLLRENRVFHWDFGRDMTLSPKPPKWKRALMVFKRFPASLFFVGRKIREIKPDVIYSAQQSHEAVFGAILSFLFRVPHLIHISYPVGDWLGWFSYRTLFHTDHLIACSKFIYDTAVSAGIASEKVETLLHGANIEHYDVPGEPARLRQEFGFPPDSPVIVTAARLDPDKGYFNLLNAFAIVREKMPEVRLLACGEGTTGKGYSQLIKDKAAELGLNGSVVFAGFRSVFLGAMAAGLPVTAVRSGGVPEMVLDNVTGLLSEPDEPEALAQNVLTLLEDKSLAKKFGENGRDWALTNFAPKKIAQEWAELLERRLT